MQYFRICYTENAMSLVSCIKDMPIKKEGDRLNAKGYAAALCKFIINSDTPITIGIQGGWGSGKTSLFTLMQSQLEADGSAFFIVVNAWEHSLFHESNGKSSVVLSILSGLVDSITREIENPKYIDKVEQGVIDKLNAGIKKTMLAITAYLPSIVSFAVSHATGQSTTFAAQKPVGQREEVKIPKLAEEIHNLKNSLNELVGTITKSRKPIKTVIFIDDLDRVPPPTAVETLDVLKNVFDIDNCVFVLAIDYEVIVKGLESKFGTRNDSNEREFRQYFDKIIQIPFTMPVGAYSQEVDILLADALKKLDIYDGMEMDKKILGSISKVARLSTGGIPRSIKRILNTLSLLQYIADSTDEKNKQSLDEKLKYLEIRFIIVALHINFPEVCKRLMEKNNFTNWKIDELKTPWQLQYDEKNKYELEELSKNSDLSIYFDEDWEKIIYCICAKSDWLKLKSYNISKIMNILRCALNNIDKKIDDDTEELDAVPLTDNALMVLSKILSSISVVSVDPDISASGVEKFKYDEISTFMRNIHRELIILDKNSLLSPLSEQLFAMPDDENNSIRSYKIQFIQGDIKQLVLTYRENIAELEIACFADKHGKNNEQCNLLLKKINMPEISDWRMPKRIRKAADEQTFKIQFTKEISLEELLIIDIQKSLLLPMMEFKKITCALSSLLKKG